MSASSFRGTVWVLLLALAAHSAVAAPGEVRATSRISATAGDFEGELRPQNSFGSSLAVLGDLDLDGVQDLAVGATDTNDATGEVWILFMRSDGTVKHEQRIREGDGGFTGNLELNDRFGSSLASLGDFDGDGVPDLAVGAWGDGALGGFFDGAVWLLFLNADGTVKDHRKISGADGGFGGGSSNAGFGTAVTSLGDLDGDGMGDIAVGQDEAGSGNGRVWILFLNPDGTVKDEREIAEPAPPTSSSQAFGRKLTALGDLDGDQVVDLAVGAYGNVYRGRVWILFLNTDGTVKDFQIIDDTTGGPAWPLDVTDHAWNVGAVGDLDGDGVTDLAVGAVGDDDGGGWAGALWILFLNTDGTAKAIQKISPFHGGCPQFRRRSLLGTEPVPLGDLDGDGTDEIAVGAPADEANGSGSVWILSIGEPEFLQLFGWIDNLRWCDEPEASAYDLIRGDLASLRATAGDFTSAIDECSVADRVQPWWFEIPDVGAGQADWFLVRSIVDGLRGTYDTPSTTQLDPRDAEIAASGADCP